MPPRVGGNDGTDWVGGPEQNAGDPLAGPRDVMSYHPGDFRDKQKQFAGLKKPLRDELHLELPKNGILPVPLTTFIGELKSELEIRGMDTVFWITTNTTDGVRTEVWVNLLESWGDVTLTQIRESMTYMETRTIRAADVPNHGDRAMGRYDDFDRDNLRLSGIVIKNSLGTNLYQRVASLLPATATGPEILKVAIDQVMYMNASTIRSVSNRLGALSLKDIPGENAPELTVKVSELARELEGSGNPPGDLINLVSKPFTKGSVESFHTQALTVHNRVMRGEYVDEWTTLVPDHNAFYQDLVHSDDYPPAKGGKQDQDQSLQALVAKTVESRLERLGNGQGRNVGRGNKKKGSRDSNKNQGNQGCYNCGAKDHFKKDCPQLRPKSSGQGNNSKWKPPTKGEPREKTIDGRLYKWCGKCRGNAGRWTTGKSAHFTHEHDESTKPSTSKESGNLGYTTEEPSQTLEYGFIGMARPKAFSGDH